MRSTMYITGKGGRFPMKGMTDDKGILGPEAGSATMVINLGDRTQNNFGNIINRFTPDVDMIIGGCSDIATG